MPETSRIVSQVGLQEDRTTR